MDKCLTSQMSIKEVVTDGHLGIAALMSKSNCTYMSEACNYKIPRSLQHKI